MIFSREIKSNFSKLFAWLLVLVILTGLLMAIYPLMMDSNMKSIFDSFLESLSPSVKSVLGFYDEIDYTNISDFLGFIFQYIAVFIVIFAMQLGANALAKEQANGSIEYIYLNPISRNEIVTQKFLANIISYLLLLILLGVATVGILFIVKLEVEISLSLAIYALAKILGGIFVAGIVFMSIGLFFSSLSKSTNFTEGTSVLFVLLVVLVAIFTKVYGGVAATVGSYLTLEVFNPIMFVKEQFNFSGLGINIVLIIIFTLITHLIYSSKELDY